MATRAHAHITEVNSAHDVMISHPAAVDKIILQPSAAQPDGPRWAGGGRRHHRPTHTEAAHTDRWDTRPSFGQGVSDRVCK
jgi:hypothetical protein